MTAHDDGTTGPEQACLRGPDAWSAFLARELGSRVDVVFTRARRTVLKVEPRGRTRSVRMNGFFAAAPPEIQVAVASWIRSGTRARRQVALLDAWVEQQIEAVERREPRRVRAVPRGRVHDLEKLARELRAAEFAGEFTGAEGTPAWPQVTWGRRGRSRTRSSLRLGSFDFWSGVVRMHPVLDQAAVPESFVRYVLFHELLHAALPFERGARGRRVYHSREFRRREREYAGTEAALAWEQQHLAELLWSARTGKEMRPSRTITRAVAAHVPASSAESELARWIQRWLF